MKFKKKVFPDFNQDKRKGEERERRKMFFSKAIGSSMVDVNAS